MTDKYWSSKKNDPNDEQINQLLSAFREIELPKRPADEDIIQRLNHMPVRRQSLFVTFFERTRKMPLFIRFGLATCAALAAIFFGIQPGGENSAFGDVEQAIKGAKSVSIEVQIDVVMPNQKYKAERTIYASPTPLRVRTETGDGIVEVLDVEKGRQLTIDAKQKSATLRIMPKPGPESPKSLLDALQLHFSPREKVATNTEELDGKKVLVYRIEKPIGNGASMIRETMWVDLKTKLPVKTFGEIVSSDPKMSQYYSRVTMSNFQWNPPSRNDKDLFSTDLPEGYNIKTIGQEKVN